MAAKAIHISPTDLLQRAERLRKRLPEDAWEARLCERAASELERAAAARDSDSALTSVLLAGGMLQQARARWRDLYQPLGKDFNKSEMGKRGGKARKLPLDGEELLSDYIRWSAKHPLKKQADYCRAKSRESNGTVKADSIRTALNRAKRKSGQSLG